MRLFLQTKLNNMDLQGKKILLRFDGNIARCTKTGSLDFFKLEKIEKTINYIIRNNGCCILLTHIGNPTEVTQDHSTQQLLPWFYKKKYAITFCNTLQSLFNIEKKPGSLILFENLRFFKEEKESDKEFAKMLAACGDIYVNDAFGTLHRTDSSITQLPEFFDDTKKTIGFLIEEELNIFNQTTQYKKSVLISGGGKPETKSSLVLQAAKQIDRILLCPLLSTTLQSTPNNIIFPVDYQIYDQNKHIIEISTLQRKDTDIIVSIGNRTLQLFTEYINQADVIIWNGFNGFLDDPQSLIISKKIAKIINNSNAFSVICGSDTIHFIKHHTHESKNIDAFVTGGGSFLALLGQQKIPGLIPFLK